jgi:FkbM family methyltransferase
MEYASHIGQDRWVHEVFQTKRDGYFLDFGAFDGTTMSNTIFLERALGWQGICVEPNPTYYPTMCSVRKAICINAALLTRSREIVNIVDAHGLSSLDYLVESDCNAELRKSISARTVAIDTINPTELLDRFRTPQIIEYMSLDVEGCEFEILSGMDLDKYRILLMTVEHNHIRAKQDRIRAYLHERGYGVAQNKNDDFFFRLDFAYPVDPLMVAESVEREYPIKSA